MAPTVRGSGGNPSRAAVCHTSATRLAPQASESTLPAANVQMGSSPEADEAEQDGHDDHVQEVGVALGRALDVRIRQPASLEQASRVHERDALVVDEEIKVEGGVGKENQGCRNGPPVLP
jgi:hypothetical protein